MSIYFLCPSAQKVRVISEGAAALKWGVERRLEFIEFRLFWEGGVNRSDIIEMFGVSVPQASKDLTLYQERAPKNAVYDKSAKRYVASPRFSPIFLKPDSDGYLSRLRSLAEGLVDGGENWISHPPEMEIAATPRRVVDVDALRAVLGATREKRSIDILYQSMSRKRADPVWRRITPHAFGYDGFRWHVRAYCHIDNKFKDFLLPRILETGSLGEAGAAADQDRLWQDDIQCGDRPASRFDAQRKSRRGQRLWNDERSSRADGSLCDALLRAQASWLIGRRDKAERTYTSDCHVELQRDGGGSTVSRLSAL